MIQFTVIRIGIDLLGLNIDSSLSWNAHIKNVAGTASCKLGILFSAKRLFTPTQRFTLYKSQVRPCLEYCSHIWGGSSYSSLALLDKVQAKAVRFIDDDKLTSTLQTLQHRRLSSIASTSVAAPTSLLVLFLFPFPFNARRAWSSLTIPTWLLFLALVLLLMHPLFSLELLVFGISFLLPFSRYLTISLSSKPLSIG